MPHENSRGVAGTGGTRRKHLLRYFAAAVLCLSGMGCNGEEPPKPAVPAPAPPDLPSLETIVPLDWAEIDPEEHPEIPGPGGTPAFAWNFARGRAFLYEFSQTVSQMTIVRAGEQRREISSRDRNRGTFLFAGEGDSRARADIKIRTIEAVVNGNVVPEAQLKKSQPTQFRCSLREDGVAEVREASGRADARFFFDALLALRPGEHPVKDGTVTTRIAGYRKVGRSECVRLETEFEIAPETVSGKSLIRGRSVGYFALRERRFVRASTAMSARIATRTLRDGAWVVTEIRSETRQRLKLKDGS